VSQITKVFPSPALHIISLEKVWTEAFDPPSCTSPGLTLQSFNSISLSVKEDLRLQDRQTDGQTLD